jgi:hypothetical protein
VIMPPWLPIALQLLAKYTPLAAEKFVELWHRKSVDKDEWIQLFRQIGQMDYDKAIAAAETRAERNSESKSVSV